MRFTETHPESASISEPTLGGVGMQQARSAAPPRMRPARAPRAQRSDARLLALDAGNGRYADLRADDLPQLLRAGDLLVVNDAATLPASLHGQTLRGEPVELRLSGAAVSEGTEDAEDTYWVALLGAGDWRTPTEHRPAPPHLGRRDTVVVGPTLRAEILALSDVSPRLCRIRFSLRGAALWSALYAHGRPVQYAYQSGELALWSVQTVYGARPWAAEMPSAGRPLSWDTLAELRRRGVTLAWLTHAAGLSATGDPALDAALPLPERYDIPAATARALTDTRARGGRIIAVGTTVVRALEGAARASGGIVPAGSGVTDLILGQGTPLRAVDGILTGIHGPEESHFRLLSAFATPARLHAAWDHAADAGYLCHEFGDLELIAPNLFP